MVGVPIRKPCVALAWLFLTAIAPYTACADEVSLANGDRYTGTVLALDRGTLAFDTGHGRVDLPWPQVASVIVDTAIVVTVDGSDSQTVPSLVSVDGQIAVGDGAAVPLAAVVALARPQGAFDLSGGASAGLLSTGGNSAINSARIDADLVARIYRDRYTTRGTLNRAKDRGIETARDASAEVRYDRFLTRTVFANGSALFTTDRFRDLDLRSALGLGLGVQLADNAKAKIGIEAGYGHVAERYESLLEPDRNYSAAREATRIEVYFLAKRIVLFHRSDNFVSLSDSTQTQAGRTAVRNINLQTHNGVRVGLGRGLVLTLQYDLDYTRSPAAGRKTTDRRSGLTFGYRF
jgi:putative salt-induced outer membrane protein YdiY